MHIHTAGSAKGQKLNLRQSPSNLHLEGREEKESLECTEKSTIRHTETESSCLFKKAMKSKF